MFPPLIGVLLRWMSMGLILWFCAGWSESKRREWEMGLGNGEVREQWREQDEEQAWDKTSILNNAEGEHGKGGGGTQEYKGVHVFSVCSFSVASLILVFTVSGTRCLHGTEIYLLFISSSNKTQFVWPLCWFCTVLRCQLGKTSEYLLHVCIPCTLLVGIMWHWLIRVTCKRGTGSWSGSVYSKYFQNPEMDTPSW